MNKCASIKGGKGRKLKINMAVGSDKQRCKKKDVMEQWRKQCRKRKGAVMIPSTGKGKTSIQGRIIFKIGTLP